MADEASSNRSQYIDWVEAVDGKCHNALFSQIRDYSDFYSNEVDMAFIRGMRTYLGRGTAGLSPFASLGGMPGNPNRSKGVTGQPLATFNLTAAAIDTLTAKLSSIKVTIQAVTNKSTVKGRQLAEDLNTLIRGLYHNLNIKNKIDEAFRGSMLSRAQYIKVCVQDGEVSLDPVFANEIFVDLADGFYNNPYKMVQSKQIPQHIMLKKFPEFAAQIKSARVAEIRSIGNPVYTPSLTVVEAWARNGYVEKGRHVICIENCDLLDEEWDKDYFPIVKAEYNTPIVGYLGQSVVDELYPIQKEIDRILATIQSVLNTVSVPRVFIDTNSAVNIDKITNKIGLFCMYDGRNGAAPIIHNGAAMPPELMQALEFQINLGYQRVGLTTLQTQGEAPSGRLSGEALDNLVDAQSERWQRLQEVYERFHVQLTETIINELKGEAIEMTALDKEIGLTKISTKKIPKTEGSFVLQMLPNSTFPKDIAGRIQTAQDLVNLGVLSPAQLPPLFDMPDIEAATVLQGAPMKLIEDILERMEDDPENYIPPEPYFNLQYAMSSALQRYSLSKLGGKDEKYLKNLRRFIDDLKQLLQQAQAEALKPQMMAQQQLEQQAQQTAQMNAGISSDKLKISQTHLAIEQARAQGDIADMKVEQLRKGINPNNQ